MTALLTPKQRAEEISSLDGNRLGTLSLAIDATSSVAGEVWECGCWRGGTALWMREHLDEGGDTGRARTLRLFDTFAGLPLSGEHDTHKVGAMAAGRAGVETLFEGRAGVAIHEGIMPVSFTGLERVVLSVVNLDVDQYESVRDCLAWLYSRLHSGGYLIIDDYNCHSCPGARRAVDAFLVGKPERLIVAGGINPQAHFIKV